VGFYRVCLQGERIGSWLALGSLVVLVHYGL